MTATKPSVRWYGDRLEVLDQTALPERTEIRTLRTIEDVVDAIARLVVRGAPLIGICAAYGVVLGMSGRDVTASGSAETELDRIARELERARPTAVNLRWAVRRVVRVALEGRTAAERRSLAAAEARRIEDEDRASCELIGEFGLAELASMSRVLTHCNTGRLATGGWGTALGIVYAKARAGEAVEVLAAETRPLLQGARLTAWECATADIPVTVVTEGAAGAAVASGRVDVVLVGCDRVARNGDTANKIGTYMHAVLARANGIPFYVAGPISSFDPDAASGSEITIEQRSADEVLPVGAWASTAVGVWNPAFDITPAEYVTAFITDAGVLRPPYRRSIAGALDRPSADAAR